MKTIGIICLLNEEVISLKSEIDIISAKNIVGLDFFMGKMLGNNVVLVRSGVGKVNVSVCTQILIDMYAVDCILSVGTAQSLSRDLGHGDIVISSDTVYHDFDTTFFGDLPGVIYGMEECFFRADEELVEFAVKAAEIETDRNYVVGRIASGDRFVFAQEEKTRIRNEFKALCVEMEGAAVAHTCYLNRVPFVIIRIVSEEAEEDSIVDYDFIFKEASVLSSKIVSGIVGMIQ